MRIYLLKSYLTSRKQYTVANNRSSSLLDLHCGVPQGSILGPLLFLIYINDCIPNVQKCKTLLYADDSVIYSSGHDFLTTQAVVQRGLNSFTDWSSRNKLTINEKKTKVIIFSSTPKFNVLKQQMTLKMNDKPLELVETMRYLGITLDYELSFKPHVKGLIKTVQYKGYLLKHAKGCLPKDARLSVYKAYIVPIIDYGDVLYNGVVVELLQKLQRLQNRCLKICEGAHRLTPTVDIHRATNMPLLKERIKYHIKLIAFKRAQDPKFRRPTIRATRLADGPVLMYHTIHCNVYQHSLEVQCAWEWLATQPYNRNIEEFLEFKHLAKKALLSKIHQDQ